METDHNHSLNSFYYKLIIPCIFFFNTYLIAQWQPDMRLTNDPATSFVNGNQTSSIAANANSIHIVWQDNRSGDWEIYYKRSTDYGLSWGTDVRLTNADGFSYSPGISAYGSILHVVWYDIRDNHWVIYYKRSTDEGITWSPDTRLTYVPSDARYPTISVSGQTVHIGWVDGRDGNEEVYYQRSTNGGISWEIDIRLSNDSLVTYSPSISASGQVIHMVWQDIRMLTNRLAYRRSTDGGLTWNIETLFNSSGGVFNPCISSSGTNLCVVWEGYIGNQEIFSKCSSNGGVTWAPETRITNNSAASYSPFVYISDQIIHIMWGDARDGGSEIYYTLSVDGGITWTSNTRLTNSVGLSEAPTITISDTILYLVWNDHRDGNWEVYYKKNPTGNLTGHSIISLEIPSKFSLSQNFPNPFNPSTNINFQLTTKSIASLKVYDLLGKEVAVLVNKQLSTGMYKADWNANDFSAGIYFYSLYADGVLIDTRKMVLIK